MPILYDLRVYSIYGVVHSVSCKAKTKDEAITSVYQMIIESGTEKQFIKVV